MMHKPISSSYILCTLFLFQGVGVLLLPVLPYKCHCSFRDLLLFLSRCHCSSTSYHRMQLCIFMVSIRTSCHGLELSQHRSHSYLPFSLLFINILYINVHIYIYTYVYDYIEYAMHLQNYRMRDNCYNCFTPLLSFTFLTCNRT